MSQRQQFQHRFEKTSSPSASSWKTVDQALAADMKRDLSVNLGWGRLIFAHTFRDTRSLAETLLEEKRGQRDIAFYIRDPHVVLSHAPEKLFLDPSHTYRVWSGEYRPGEHKLSGIVIRRARSTKDARAINAIFAHRKMVSPPESFVVDRRGSRTVTFFVCEDETSGDILGTITGVDHVHAFGDPENGASFWCLAVHPQAAQPGVGEALVRHVIEYYFARGRAFVDLSVMHDNDQAIALYQKLGFQRVPVFAVKRKNPINEPLFTATDPAASLNPYAAIIVKEAQRRGISAEVLDEETGHFVLSYGGRSVTCWESLSELTSAIAMVRCDDKRMTSRMLRRAGLNVPDQRLAGSTEENEAFLAEHASLVVKPKSGEQGAGISVDVRSPEELAAAVQCAGRECSEVLLEQYVQGRDLRIIVIDHKVVAAAVRCPASITGTGTHTVKDLIAKQSRRRAAATGGESKIPVDDETVRCVRAEELEMDDVPEKGRTVIVRKAANLHTGGTIHDVTEELHPELVQAAEKASRVLDIPVVGFDFLVRDVNEPDYVIIEANERAGLANHEPAPTAQRFVDLLFPQTADNIDG